MNTGIRFSHTNIIAKDWKSLAKFYIDVFDCVPVYPERSLAGEWLDKLTKVDNAEIKGIHLKLPGYTDGPTLEIFEYNTTSATNTGKRINNSGFSHIAFHVDDVKGMLEKLIEHGGKTYGETIVNNIEGVGILTAVYAADPEGNIIEIQNWKK